MAMLRAVLVGAILFVATVVVHTQDVRDTVGPLEKSATQSSPENPIPRRLSAPPASRVQEWRQLTGRGFVRFQVTLDTAGRIGEIRKLIEPVVQISAGSAADEDTRRAIADAIMKSAATSVSQWTYEPPKAPITFAVALTFLSGADPIAVQDPSQASPRGGGPVPTLVGGAPPPPPWPAAQGVTRVGGSVPPPRQTKTVRPTYPREAQAEHASGIVILELLIGANGKVADVRVIRSSPLLDKAAIEATRKWEYEPTRINGVAVPVVMTANVTFSLR